MSWTHLKDTTPKARKEYKCHLCGLPIPVGEVHVHRTGVGDDGLDSARMHQVCEAGTHGWDEDDWEGHDQSEFREWLAWRSAGPF